MDIVTLNKFSANRVLINMSNIHGGGSLQVAASFVSELLLIDKPDWNIKILISNEIAGFFDSVTLEESDWNFEIFNTYGLKTLASNINIRQKKFNVVFTLFGPKYTLTKPEVDIVGFAQLWILEFDNSISRSLSFFEKWKLRLKFSLQKRFFQRADHMIVELEHVKQGLSDRNVFNRNRISVVYNTLSNLYLDKSLWQDVVVNRNESEISIGFLTRDYIHKNIKVLPRVAKILNEKYRLPVRFYLSLTSSEWVKYQQDFNGLGETVGPLNIYQCPSFYQKMDAVIFPSLLECFSATPLEALAMKKPLFASDKGFVRDVCQDYAIYFDPLDAENIAWVVSQYFINFRKSDDELEAARNHALEFSNAKQRAQDYLKIIQQHLEA